MPQETKTHEIAQTLGEKSLQGLIASREDEGAMLDALEKAFDYRGDVTLTLNDGRSVMGYIFDRRRGASLADSIVRLMPAPPAPDAGRKVSVRFSEIARVEFSGKDAAHGKTFENWVKRFTEKRLKGESAGIESEELH